MSLEMLGTDTATWPVDLLNEFKKSVSTVQEAEGKRLGEIMFRYKDTYGLTKNTIDIEMQKATEGEEYKLHFSKLVVLDMAKRGIDIILTTKARTLMGEE